MEQALAPDPTREFFVAFDGDEDDASFVDLVMSDQDGVFFRADRGWQAYQPTSRALEGKTVVDVSEEAARLFDKQGSITIEQARSKRLAPDE